MPIPDVNLCSLETTGRRTGRPHEIEIWYAVRGDTICLLSGGGDRADWVQNLRVNPTVRVRIKGQWFDGTAREIAGTAAEQGAREAVAAKYYEWTGGPLPNDWARESLPVAIQLTEPTTS